MNSRSGELRSFRPPGSSPFSLSLLETVHVKSAHEDLSSHARTIEGAVVLPQREEKNDESSQARAVMMMCMYVSRII